jgi:hypothetical protein
VSKDGESAKPSRAEYHRRRRAAMSEEEKLQQRELNKKRMRHKRGSSEPFWKQYPEGLEALTDNQRLAAILLLETPEDMSLAGALTPGFRDIRRQFRPDENGELRFATKGTRAAKAMTSIAVADVINPPPCDKTIERLPLSAAAVKNRRRAFVAYHEKRFLRDQQSKSSRSDIVGRGGAPSDAESESGGDSAAAAGGRSWIETLQSRVEKRDRATALRRAKYGETLTDEQKRADKVRKRGSRRRVAEGKIPPRFVAIDAEGLNVGEPFEVVPDDPKIDYGLEYDPAPSESKLMAQNHATFLWGAGDAADRRLWLGDPDKRALTGIEILEWLTSLPKAFGESAIFVMFAANYDWTQIIRHGSPEKQWELWKGIPWPKYLRQFEWPSHDDYKDEKSNPNRYVLWGGYALSLLPGKQFRIAKLRDRNHPWDRKGKWDFASKPITIFDAFGFFQMKFTEAVRR